MLLIDCNTQLQNISNHERKRKKCGCSCNGKAHANDQEAKQYPGVATDLGLNDKVNKELVKEATKELNNNHRGNN